MKDKNEINLVIPEDLEEYYVTGGAVRSTSFDIRLILFDDELIKNDEISNSNSVKLNKSAKAEIIMHPAVAKQISDLLNKELENYMNKVKELNKS